MDDPVTSREILPDPDGRKSAVVEQTTHAGSLSVPDLKDENTSVFEPILCMRRYGSIGVQAVRAAIQGHDWIVVSNLRIKAADHCRFDIRRVGQHHVESLLKRITPIPLSDGSAMAKAQTLKIITRAVRGVGRQVNSNANRLREFSQYARKNCARTGSHIKDTQRLHTPLLHQSNAGFDKTFRIGAWVENVFADFEVERPKSTCS